MTGSFAAVQAWIIWNEYWNIPQQILTIWTADIVHITYKMQQ